MLKLSICVFFLLVFTGCASFHTNTQIPDPAEYSVPGLDVMQPVTIRNGVPESGDIMIGRLGIWNIYGDYYKYTESAIGAATNIFESNHIKVQHGADKVLELSVYEAKSRLNEKRTGSGSTVIETIALRVRTGDGLTKDYFNSQVHGVVFSATRAIERALAQCVVQMLSDKEIISYLEKNDEEYYSPQNSFDDGDEYYSPEE